VSLYALLGYRLEN